MPYQSHGKTYCKLSIIATSPDTEIWIGCDQGHFVSKATGRVEEGLLPGRYFVEFGLGNPCYPIDLTDDREFTQTDLESGPSCTRPPVVLEDEQAE